MSRRLLIIVIILVSFALTGIIYVQLYYIKNAYAQNEVHFDQKVNAALNDLADKLEQKETFEIIHEELKGKNNLKPVKESDLSHTISSPGLDSVFFIEFNDSLVHSLIVSDSTAKVKQSWSTSDENIIVIREDKPSFRSKIKSKSKNKRAGRTYVSKTWISNDDTLIINSKNDGFSSNYVYATGQNKTIRIERKVIDEKTEKIKNVIKKMVTEADVNFNTYRKKLKYGLIDSLLKNSLDEKGVQLPYQYAVLSENRRNGKLPGTNHFDLKTEDKKYEANLFPNDIIPKKDKLVIYFPDRQSHLLQSLSFLLPSSLVFSIIIIVAFAISIMMVVRQKKISDIKSDFINNMTHEFKTPIATISLAADTVVNPKVINDQEKINHFIRIIKDENKRMNLQVERILQMSLLDKRELDLNLGNTDIHVLLQKAVENINMQLSNKHGKMETAFNARESSFEIDEIHFTNVINNLLDNALKYSKEIPQIKINTEQTTNGIIISVEDNGIGMTKEAQTRIFDKFYRVTKKNIHNVKGFGLGLSYVKAIVEAHGGRIQVKSELNKGSRFDIFIPQKRNGNGRTGQDIFS